MKKYIVKVQYKPGLHSYYTVNTKEEAEHIAKQPGCSMTRKVWYNADDIHELSEGWVSPEDYQKVVEDLTNARSSITNLMAQLDYYKKDKRFEVMAEEILSLKSQLAKQQPGIPEVPQFVGDWLDRKPLYAINGSIPVEVIEWSKEQTGYADLGMNINHLLKLKVNGYTVAKEKRFYLKHKSVLIFDPDSDDSDVDELYLGAGGNFVPYQHLAKIFTQSQIDRMETGSYEQIEVEE